MVKSITSSPSEQFIMTSNFLIKIYHCGHISDTLECEIWSTICHSNKHLLDWFVMVLRIYALGRTKSLGLNTQQSNNESSVRQI